MSKILIADEGASVRILVEKALEGTRIEVLYAASGGHAVERIERERPDLVVSDVYMPDRDGYQICDFVKAHPRLGATPVLLMADIVDSTVLARAARVRADDVLRKPFAPDLLLGRIRSLLAGAPADSPVKLQNASLGAQAAGDLKTVLGRLAALPGVPLAVLVDREGFLIEWAGEMALQAEVVGAVVSRLAETAEGIDRELGQGTLQCTTFEYDAGLLLLSDVGPGIRLGVILREPAILGMVRYSMKQALPALAPHEGHAVPGAT